MATKLSLIPFSLRAIFVEMREFIMMMNERGKRSGTYKIVELHGIIVILLFEFFEID